MASKYRKQTVFFEEQESINNGSYIKESHRILIESLQKRETDIIPVIMTSNTSGLNIDFVKEFLFTLKSKSYLQKKGYIDRNLSNPQKYPLLMYIDNTYTITGIGIVLSGTVKYGEIKLGQKVFFGTCQW